MSLVIRFTREGLGATASYRLGHSMDDASNFNAGAVFPLSVNRSDSDFDIRHTFAASPLYDAPTPFKSNSVASAVLGHWSFDLIYHFQTAPPVNPIASLNASNGIFTETQSTDTTTVSTGRARSRSPVASGSTPRPTMYCGSTATSAVRPTCACRLACRASIPSQAG
jgi:hypothetical protein